MTMALLPSGSAHEEVELVVIDTEICSVVIKGRPFHPKYESLQQYHSMDFHDLMQLDVHGEGVKEVRVFDVGTRELVPHTHHRPIFFENSVYQVMVFPKHDEDLSFYHENPSFRKAVTPLYNQKILAGNLHFQNDIGLSTFEIRQEHKTILEVTIEVFPSKLDYKRDYQKLLEEVNDEIYNLAYHFIKKTYLGAKTKLEGTPSLAEFYRLICVHFATFLDAIHRIERQPHHKLVKVHEKKRGDQLQRFDTKGRAYLRKRAHVFVDVENGIRIQERTLMPTEGLKMKKTLTYDTTENRYVKWMMGRLLQRLELLHQKLSTNHRRQEVEVDQELLSKIDTMIKELKMKRRNVFWRDIGSLDRSVMSLVLQMAPGYRDAFKIYLTVSKGLSLQGKLYQMSVKDVATLYEYWTYLKLGQILARKYEQVSQDIIKVSRDGLYVNLESNTTARRVFKHPITNEKIELTYQKREVNLPTVQQKPDVMLTIAKKGKDYAFNYIFDAKYRIDFAAENTYYGSRYQTAGPLEEDINTMHRYRDSIVVKQNGPYERNAFGAYVLFPWSDEVSYQSHDFYKSIDKVNIGGLPFLPNATDLVERFVEHLIDKSPEEILEEGILPRGVKEEWISSLDDKVLVAVVSTIEQYQDCMHNLTLTIPNEHLKKGWQEASYLALYISKETGLQNGIKYYAKITSVEARNSSIAFSTDVWEELSSLIKPVNYGVAASAVTTLNQLIEAKELPELFMKSPDELAVWRMLRRVSDQIKVDLNEDEIDKAHEIHSYEFKGIKLTLFSKMKILKVKKNFSVSTIDLNLLQKNPSTVFKKIIEVMKM